MFTESEESNPANPEETLKRIHANLKDAKAQTRLSAIQELLDQKFSSPAILRTLEQMALKDKSNPVREAAHQALNSPTHRYIQGRIANLKQKDRRAILDEIKSWEQDGLLQEDQAEVLRQRYDFDLKPVTPPPSPKPEPIVSSKVILVKESTPATPLETQPAQPRASLTQTLLSETSIKIALYLGAFFVVAAAAILAAAVEAFRLPILFLATVLFAGGAFVTRTRLSQPSFALFIVFSFLLPTDANVLADVLNLAGSANSGYWFIIMVIMALIWGFGTWFYTSRLFSLAAFIALIISAFRLGEIFDEPEIYLLLLSFATFVGLGGAYVLKRWQAKKFSLPLLILVQITQLGMNAFALVTIFIRMNDLPNAWNLASTAFWLLTAGFYVLSNIVFPFVLFPWLAVATLYPIPMVFMMTFEVEAAPVAIATWIWGVLLAASSEVLHRNQTDEIHLYSLPFVTGSLLVILTSILIGFVEEVRYGFTLMLGSTILYGVLQILKPRVFIWVTSLLFGLGAYFSFFALSFMEQANIFFGYQLLGASLLFLLPDLFLSPNLSADKNWRWPLRTIGTILFVINTMVLVSVNQDDSGKAALIFVACALFFTIYTLRYKKALFGYLVTIFTALSLTFVIQHFELQSWLLILISLSVLYYLTGFVIGQNEERLPWSNMLRYSGLALSTVVSLNGAITSQDSNGWYALITASLFAIELFSRHASLAEAGTQLFFATGLFTLLGEAKIAQSYQWLGISLALLGLDLALARTYTGNRPLAWISRGLGALFVVFNTLDILFSTSDAQVSAVCFAIYTLFFLIQALLYRPPILGYGISLYSVLTIITTLNAFKQEHWLLPVTALAIIFYVIGFYLRKRKSETTKSDILALEWPFVLWTSGLGIGLLVTALAPVQDGLAAAIPVALTATMVAVEAFDRRNIWLGFPTNALYLMAYFILLIELNVDEPQFFSIATAALGLLMHYLLTRAGSRTGAFITGMVSQLVLLGTTYIQFVSTERLIFFAVMFFQALVVLVYGVIIRSRSLVITPIIFTVLSVLTVLYGLLEGILPVLLIGCTGVILLMLGIFAVIMRNRLKQISERFNDWGA